MNDVEPGFRKSSSKIAAPTESQRDAGETQRR